MVAIRADGGVGKTALAAAVVGALVSSVAKGERPAYDHVAWIRYTGDVAGDLASLEVLGANITSREERIRAVMAWLRTTDERTLLVIDNMDERLPQEEEDLLASLSPDVRVLITTRATLGFAEEYPLKPMQEDQALQMLYAYYLDSRKPLPITDIEPRHDAEAARKIVKAAASNTLLIELIARAAQSGGGGLTTYWDAHKDDLFQGNGAALRTSHATSHGKGGLTLTEQITRLYSLSSATDEQRRIMELLAQFPANAPVYYKLREWSGFSQDDMNALVRLGWVERGEQSYSIHTIVRESVLAQLRIQHVKVDPCKFGDLVDEVADTDEYLGITEGYETVCERMLLPETVIQLLKDAGYEDLRLAQLCNNLGAVCRAEGDYAAARRHHELALSILERAIGPDHPDTKRARRNLERVLSKLHDE